MTATLLRRPARLAEPRVCREARATTGSAGRPGRKADVNWKRQAASTMTRKLRRDMVALVVVVVVCGLSLIHI